jgi:regulation of enolase protein 1 (concanavalin A-like superfamily)
MIKNISAVILLFGLCSPALAQFTDDEFNVPGVLGLQWTQHDSTPPGSTFTLTGAALRLTAKEGSDFWSVADDHAYIEQNAPVGSNWEIVTKVDNFNPTLVGFKRTFIRTGIQLRQDNDHWISVGILGNFDGSDIGIQAFWQTDPVAGRHEIRYFGENLLSGVTTSPLYLKLQKTPKGYMGLVSDDGSSWTTVLPIVRNPDSPTGYFTGEKIRLYQSGGPVSGTGVSSPADFDYVHSAFLAAPQSGFEDDEFNGTSLSSKWGFYPGFREGNHSVGSGQLSMTSGPFQDLWEGVERNMHVYEDAPTSSSYVASIKVGPTNLVPFEQWIACGIMLWQDQCNWIFISNQRSETSTNRVEIAFKRNGLFSTILSDFGTGALPEYLQIEKTPSGLTPRYSFDNTNWTAVPSGGYIHPAGLQNAQVRLFAKRVFDTGPVPTAQFDWLHYADAPTAAQDWQLLD